VSSAAGGPKNVAAAARPKAEVPAAAAGEIAARVRVYFTMVVPLLPLREPATIRAISATRATPPITSHSGLTGQAVVVVVLSCLTSTEPPEVPEVLEVLELLDGGSAAAGCD
jgi:hypothetical protein